MSEPKPFSAETAPLFADAIFGESTRNFDLLKAEVPIDREFERYIVGSAITSGDVRWWTRVSGELEGVKFEDPACRYIAYALNELAAAGQELSKLRVIDTLRKQGRLDLIGGEFGLDEIIDLGDFSPLVDYEIGILREKAKRRELVAAGKDLVCAMMSPEDEQEDLEGFIEGFLTKMERFRYSANKDLGIKLGDAIGRTRNFLADRNDPMKPGRMGFGIPTFDRLTGGIEGGTLYLFAARPGQGKTDIAIDCAARIAEQYPDKKVLIFTPEITIEDIGLRFLSREAATNSGSVRRSRDVATQAETAGAYERLRSNENVIVYTDFDMKDFGPQMIRGAIAIHKPDVVFVDHVQLMYEGRYPNLKTHEAANRVVTELKNIAKSRYFRVPIVAFSQMSRENERQSKGGLFPIEPQLSDLRDAGEQPADVVAFNFNPYPDEEENREFYWLIRKNRRGPLGRAGVRWIRGQSRFQELVAEEQTYEIAKRERRARSSQPRPPRADANRVVTLEEQQARQ